MFTETNKNTFYNDFIVMKPISKLIEYITFETVSCGILRYSFEIVYLKKKTVILLF